MRGAGASSAGLVLLGTWLILWGLVPLVGIRIPGSDVVLGLLAIIAGVLIIIGR